MGIAIGNGEITDQGLECRDGVSLIAANIVASGKVSRIDEAAFNAESSVRKLKRLPY